MATQSSLRAPGPRIKLPSIVTQSARKAIKIAVFANGDCYSRPKPLVFDRRVRSLDTLLERATTMFSKSKSQSRGALRRLYRIPDGKRVTDLSDVVDGGSYVVATREGFKQMPYTTTLTAHDKIILNKRKSRQAGLASSNSYRKAHSKRQAKVQGRLRLYLRDAGNNAPPRTRVVYFLRNGEPRQGYCSLVLSGRNSVNIDQVLQRLTFKMGDTAAIRNVYTLDGQQLVDVNEFVHMATYVATTIVAFREAVYKPRQAPPRSHSPRGRPMLHEASKRFANAPRPPDAPSLSHRTIARHAESAAGVDWVTGDATGVALDSDGGVQLPKGGPWAQAERQLLDLLTANASFRQTWRGISRVNGDGYERTSLAQLSKSTEALSSIPNHGILSSTAIRWAYNAVHKQMESEDSIGRREAKIYLMVMLYTLWVADVLNLDLATIATTNTVITRAQVNELSCLDGPIAQQVLRQRSNSGTIGLETFVSYYTKGRCPSIFHKKEKRVLPSQNQQLPTIPKRIRNSNDEYANDEVNNLEDTLVAIVTQSSSLRALWPPIEATHERCRLNAVGAVFAARFPLLDNPATLQQAYAQLHGSDTDVAAGDSRARAPDAPNPTATGLEPEQTSGDGWVHRSDFATLLLTVFYHTKLRILCDQTACDPDNRLNLEEFEQHCHKLNMGMTEWNGQSEFELLAVDRSVSIATFAKWYTNRQRLEVPERFLDLGYSAHEFELLEAELRVVAGDAEAVENLWGTMTEGGITARGVLLTEVCGKLSEAFPLLSNKSALLATCDAHATKRAKGGGADGVVDAVVTLHQVPHLLMNLFFFNKLFQCIGVEDDERSLDLNEFQECLAKLDMNVTDAAVEAEFGVLDHDDGDTDYAILFKDLCMWYLQKQDHDQRITDCTKALRAKELKHKSSHLEATSADSAGSQLPLGLVAASRIYKQFHRRRPAPTTLASARHTRKPSRRTNVPTPNDSTPAAPTSSAAPTPSLELKAASRTSKQSQRRTTAATATTTPASARSTHKPSGRTDVSAPKDSIPAAPTNSAAPTPSLEPEATRRTSTHSQRRSSVSSSPTLAKSRFNPATPDTSVDTATLQNTKAASPQPADAVKSRASPAHNQRETAFDTPASAVEKLPRVTRTPSLAIRRSLVVHSPPPTSPSVLSAQPLVSRSPMPDEPTVHTPTDDGITLTKYDAPTLTVTATKSDDVKIQPLHDLHTPPQPKVSLTGAASDPDIQALAVDTLRTEAPSQR
eukprot:m.167086 g.167086  ORF g.167086 m.167086 type:complete len:1242 (-) comp24080_c0_seq1:41-3766(-)